MKINLNDVKKILTEEKSMLAATYGVTHIGIFGSFAFGDFGKDSDIDILVEFKHPIALFEYLKLENYLSKKLGRKVDLVDKAGLKPYVKKDILRSAVYA
jgi:uncharacterized protein